MNTKTNKTYQLTVNPDYVPSWGVWEGCREFIQNCIDGDNASCRFEGNTLILSNSGKLDISTLLIGSTSKATDKTKLGQFGEGYKLGFLALARQDVAVTVYTGNGTIWYPELQYSELYQSMILSIIEKESNGVEEGIVIKIVLTEEQKEEIQTKYLGLRDNGKTTITTKGIILHDEKFKGKLFIGGLFILDTKTIWGYNFPISAFEINRDRNFARSYEVLSAIASVYLSGFDEGLIPISTIYEGVINGIADFENIVERRYLYNNFTTAFYEHFKATNGTKYVYSSEEGRTELLDCGIPLYDLIEVNWDTRSILQTCWEYSSNIPKSKKETIEEIVDNFEEVLAGMNSIDSSPLLPIWETLKLRIL
jgi:hypothetical protein